MYCTNCGKEIPDDSVFCIFCGQKVDGGVSPEPKAAESGTQGQQPVKPPVKMNKKSLAVAGGVVAAVVVIGGATMLFSSPKATVAKGFQKTWKAVCQEETGLDAYLGMNSIGKMIKDGSSSQKLTGNASVSLWGAQLGDADVSIQFDREKNNKAYVTAGASYSGMDLGTVSVYMDKKSIYAASPEFLDGSFYLNLKDVEKKLNDSDYLEELWDDQRIFLQEGMSSDVDAFMTEVQRVVKKDVKSLYKNMNVKKSGKETFSIDGKDKKCQGYDVTISEDDLKKIVEDIANTYLDEYGATGTFMPSDYTYDECLEQSERDVDEMRQEIKKYTSMIKDDLNFQVYVGPKGRVVSVKIEKKKLSAAAVAEVTSMQVGGTASVEVNLLGGKNPMDDMSVKGEVKFGDGTSASLELSRELKDTKTDIDDTIELALAAGSAYGSNRTNIELNGQVDKRNGQWEISLRSPILNTTFSADGTFENVKKGKSFSVSLENINLGSYSSEYGILDLEMTYEVAPLKGSISNDLPQKTIYDILDMSEDDWTEIENEIDMNARAIGI